ncbi:MAG: dihydroorotate dehydrogenase, partial [Halieaceae bacterium]|nr:dihydroorotate dehydrogenase [Halieaceae bacterium]
RSAMEAGAEIIGVGSALTGLTTQQTEEYFKLLEQDLLNNKDLAKKKIRYDVDMNFEPVTLTENIRVCEDIAILRFDKKINIKPGEFVFLWLPGIGEKPFSALVDDPFSLVIINVGVFTSACMSLEVGVKAYVRGPYGTPVSPPKGKIMAVAGGTGLAAVYQIARDIGNTEIFSGARSAERLYFTKECKKISTLHVATDDGSEGFHGLVTELLRKRLNELSEQDLKDLVFYNCGPEPMVHAAVAVEREYCRDDQIFSAIDYLTKCGVGICGACSAPDGRRICVDGPFLCHS